MAFDLPSVPVFRPASFAAASLPDLVAEAWAVRG